MVKWCVLDLYSICFGHLIGEWNIYGFSSSDRILIMVEMARPKFYLSGRQSSHCRQQSMCQYSIHIPKNHSENPSLGKCQLVSFWVSSSNLSPFVTFTLTLSASHIYFCSDIASSAAGGGAIVHLKIPTSAERSIYSNEWIFRLFSSRCQTYDQIYLSV